MNLDTRQIWDSFLFALSFVPQTLVLTFVPFLVTLVLGGLIAIIRVLKIPVLAQLLTIVVAVFKGIPIYLFLIFSFLLMTMYFNPFMESLGSPIRQKNVSPLLFAAVILSIAFTPAMSDVLRGAILSVDQGQYEAAATAGLTTGQTFRRIIIPQVVPAAIPNVTNMLIGIMKGSALGYSVGVTDVLSASIRDASAAYDIIEAYIAAAVIYWAMSIIIERLMGLLARHAGRFRNTIG
ncbi:amino acid ABC transporter permease [Bifidobacterium callitrichos]|nr:amino acid ABC transporter permease [Bifidobacterium callitrichos]